MTALAFSPPENTEVGPDMTICRIQSGDLTSPVILHVPHASRAIPDTVRAGLLPSAAELQPPGALSRTSRAC